MTAVMVEEQEILSVMAIVIEPIVSENLPFGFDSSTCRSVYVGNIHLQVTDSLLHEVFQSIGPVEGCKFIRKEKVVSLLFGGGEISTPAQTFEKWVSLVRKRSGTFRPSGFPRRSSRIEVIPSGSFSLFSTAELRLLV
ncbi:uncharacterized protein LOC104585111 isoform X1 [Brachypodium distachyon]|uniref:uncharacterized protein LOC104585111 isoform X1 n=1 Tax=Brachypodium distachyon TaxID=15368 RepID=UPI000D0E23BE|nr:uncharacterized protein LOC104585111 isoform X1 [Brachypodium distachyon]|eukprot:XP_024318616.1 uncharacterized protein LOC104585111 isoform X1 [Brachypodium distachyon]